MEQVLTVISKEQLEDILQMYKENKKQGLIAFKRALTPSFFDCLKGATTQYQNYSLKEFKALLDELAQEK